MKKNHWIALISLCAMLTILTVGLAEAATGTLKYSFKSKDPVTGVVTNLPTGFVYLRDVAKPPPMEKYFSKADYINIPSFSNGNYSDPNVPVGTWYIRITQRKVVGGVPLGPPQEGDYTWSQTAPITIVAGQTLDLGTLYAIPFGPSPITITGTIKNQNGVPVTGQYVRAQTAPCFDDGYNNNINQCGPAKFLALKPTDANGKYTLQIKDPGAYYVYTSPCITADHDDYIGNRCRYTAAPGPVILKIRDTKTLDMVIYTP
jgi:hypothetical protein